MAGRAAADARWPAAEGRPQSRERVGRDAEVPERSRREWYTMAAETSFDATVIARLR
jgi:hypothetical protein